jgi:hypothetical protein
MDGHFRNLLSNQYVFVKCWYPLAQQSFRGAERRTLIESPTASDEEPLAARNRCKRFLGSPGGTRYSYRKCARYQLLLRVVRGLVEKNNFPVVRHSARTI